MIGLEFITKSSDMNYSEVANKLSISRKTINDWVKGRSKIPKKRLTQLSELFDLPEDYFNKELDSLEKSKINEIFAKREVEKNPEDLFLNLKYKIAQSETEIELELKKFKRTILEIIKLNFEKDVKKTEEFIQTNSEDEYEDKEDTYSQISFNRIEKYLELLKQDDEEILIKIDAIMFKNIK